LLKLSSTRAIFPLLFEIDTERHSIMHKGRAASESLLWLF
jgi:hypothetical protein